MNLLLLFVSFIAFANPQEVVQDIFTKSSQEEVIKNLEKQEEVQKHIDYDTLAKNALGKYYKTTSKKDFDWFKLTLKQIIALTIFPKAPEFLKDVSISYSDVKEKKDKAFVSSQVQNKADFTDVSYDLKKSGEDWVVTDISIAGLSWTDSIRDQVSDVLKKKKWKGLKDLMGARLKKLQEEKK